MAGFVKGEVVVLPFPYSDLSQAKRRPALVVADSSGPDVVLCQITSRAVADGDALPLDGSHFASGALSKPSNVRPNKLFTADSRIVLYQVGTLKQAALDAVTNKSLKFCNGEESAAVP
jgi:mRNA interferase MazF